MARVSPVTRFNEFLIGVVAAVAFTAGWRPRIKIWQASLAVVASLALCSYLPIAPAASNELLLPVFLALIFAAVRSDVDRRSGILTRRWLVRAGEVSFAFYLVHELVMLNVRSWLGFNGPLMAALVVGVAAVCAAVLHRAVERPLQIRLRGAEGRSQETSAVNTSSARGGPHSGPEPRSTRRRTGHWVAVRPHRTPSVPTAAEN